MQLVAHIRVVDHHSLVPRTSGEVLDALLALAARRAPGDRYNTRLVVVFAEQLAQHALLGLDRRDRRGRRRSTDRREVRFRAAGLTEVVRRQEPHAAVHAARGHAAPVRGEREPQRRRPARVLDRLLTVSVQAHDTVGAAHNKAVVTVQRDARGVRRAGGLLDRAVGFGVERAARAVDAQRWERIDGRTRRRGRGRCWCRQAPQVGVGQCQEV